MSGIIATAQEGIAIAQEAKIATINAVAGIKKESIFDVDYIDEGYILTKVDEQKDKLKKSNDEAEKIAIRDKIIFLYSSSEKTFPLALKYIDKASYENRKLVETINNFLNGEVSWECVKNQCSAKFQNNFIVNKFIGLGLLEDKKFKLALDYLNIAVQINPEDMDVLYGIKECYEELLKEEQAEIVGNIIDVVRSNIVTPTHRTSIASRVKYIYHKQDELFESYKNSLLNSSTKIFNKDTYEAVEYKKKEPDLLGKTVKVTQNQFEMVFNIVSDISDALSIEAPVVYVYEDFYYGAESIGVGPYWIEISAKTIRDFNEDELRFLLAREIFKIADKATYENTLFTEIVSKTPWEELRNIERLSFYKWYRSVELSADQFGYLCCGNFSAAIHVVLMEVLNSRTMSNEIDIYEFMKQTSDINKLHGDVYDNTKADEVAPYAPFRIKNLLAYAISERALS